MKTQEQIRSEFAAYFLDLKQAQAQDGATVNKYDEWDFFIKAMIAEGKVPEEASQWKCPKTLKVQS